VVGRRNREASNLDLAVTLDVECTELAATLNISSNAERSRVWSAAGWRRAGDDPTRATVPVFDSEVSLVAVRSLVAALLGAWILERLEVPAGALIGAMLAGAAVNLAGFDARPLPDWARFAAFAAIGWLLGQQFTRETVATLRAAVVPVLIVVTSLLIAGGLVALLLRRFGLDAGTALLAASPGGISQMAALAADTGANAPLVVTAHLVRVISVVITAPFLVRFLTDR
jgi:membrane AbrB-like protein